MYEESDHNHEAKLEAKFVWTDAATRLFLSTFKEKRELVQRRKIKNLSAMWNEIAEKMKKEGYQVEKTQVENRYKTLLRAFKETVSNNMKTGRARKTCAYEK